MNAHNPDPLPRFGRRIVLRRLTPHDLADFQAYRHDPDVGLYQSWTPRPDPETLIFLKEMNQAELFRPAEWFQIGVADRVTNMLIGDIGVCLSPDGREVEIGFTLRKASQGSGLGSEAVREVIDLIFARTHASRVVAVTDARNLPSIRLLERVGMEKLTTLPSRFRGEACIEHTYALSRKEEE